MLDLRLVRERPEALREAYARRGALEALAPTLDRLEALERERGGGGADEARVLNGV